MTSEKIKKDNMLLEDKDPKEILDSELEQATGGYTDSEGMVVTPLYSCNGYKEAFLPGVAAGCGTCSHMYVKNLVMYCSRNHESKKL